MAEKAQEIQHKQRMAELSMVIEHVGKSVGYRVAEVLVQALRKP